MERLLRVDVLLVHLDPILGVSLECAETKALDLKGADTKVLALKGADANALDLKHADTKAPCRCSPGTPGSDFEV